jgi:uncharacterized protein YbcI
MTELIEHQPRVTATMLAPDRRSGALAVKISNLVVQLYRHYTGRGPTKARTVISENLIVVELRDTLTAGERTLVASSQHAPVKEIRTAYVETMRAPLIAAVEQQTGRSVLALLSDCNLHPDIAVAVFVLAPLGPDAAAGA